MFGVMRLVTLQTRRLGSHIVPGFGFLVLGKGALVTLQT